jgi:hypothetical protein
MESLTRGGKPRKVMSFWRESVEYLQFNDAGRNRAPHGGTSSEGGACFWHLLITTRAHDNLEMINGIPRRKCEEVNVNLRHDFP